MIKKLAISLSAAALIGLSGTASALPVASSPGNDSLASAQDINGFFDLSANPQIENATTIPHAEIINLSGDDTFDFFFFSVGADNTSAVFDIDCGRQYLGSPNTGCTNQDNNFDSWLDLFTTSGVLLATSDDNSGDPGSENTALDSLIQTTLDAGDYAIRVSSFPGVEIPDGASYVLNVSIDNPPPSTVPAPGVVLLFGLGLIALGSSRRRTR